MMTSYMRMFIFHFGLIQFDDEPHICTILECKPKCSYHSHIWYAFTWFTIYVFPFAHFEFLHSFVLFILFQSFFFKLCSFFCLFGYFFSNKLRRMFTIVKMQKNVFSKWIKKMKRWLKVSISITAMLVSQNAFNFQMAENQRWKWK